MNMRYAMIVCFSRSSLQFLGFWKLTFTKSFPKPPCFLACSGVQPMGCAYWRLEEREDRVFIPPRLWLGSVFLCFWPRSLLGSPCFISMAFTRLWWPHSFFLPLLARWLMACHCCYPWILHHPLLLPLTLLTFLKIVTSFNPFQFIFQVCHLFPDWIMRQGGNATQSYIFCLYISCFLYLKCLLPIFA